MYGTPNAADESKAHLGGIAESMLHTNQPETPFGVITHRIHELADNLLVSKEDAAKAIHALKAWMAVMPEDVEALAHAEQFFAEWEGSHFAYLPEPYLATGASPTVERGEDDDSEHKFNAKRHWMRSGWDPSDLDLTLEEFAKKHGVDPIHLEDLREFEVK
jgi:hypothetical protein